MTSTDLDLTSTDLDLTITDLDQLFDEFPSLWGSSIGSPITAALALVAAVAVAWALFVTARAARAGRIDPARHTHDRAALSTSTAAQPERRGASVGSRGLVVIAVLAAIGVAGLGGVRSFDAVSDRFGSPLVPLTADGMIIACTALRLAALSRGWRLPGSLVTTYGFIGGTVWLNVAAAQGWAGAVAHALAPISYAVLVEMLAHLLRLHLRLAQSSRPRVTALTWITSPIVTTRVWLHMARTGEPDPVVARALVQQLIRMSSRLHAVCPNRVATRFDHRPDGIQWSNLLASFSGPFGRARAARSAALQTIRDGVLTAAELAALLPVDGVSLDPGALLALVDRAALTHGPTPTTATAAVDAPTSATSGALTGAPTSAVNSAPTGAPTSAPTSAVNGATTSARLGGPDGAPSGPGVGAASAALDVPRHATGHGTSRAHEPRHSAASDDDLVAELRRYAAAHHGGQPLTQRHVMRVLGVGTPKAKRLTEIAWPHAHGPSGEASR